MSVQPCNEDKSVKHVANIKQYSQPERDDHQGKLLDQKMARVQYKFMVFSGNGGIGEVLCGDLNFLIKDLPRHG
jgi:hypothetical protein